MISGWLNFEVPLEFRPYPDSPLPIPYVTEYRRGSNLGGWNGCDSFDYNPALDDFNSFRALFESFNKGIEVKLEQVATEDCGFQTRVLIIQRQAIAWALVDTLVLNNSVKIVVKDICMCDSNAV